MAEASKEYLDLEGLEQYTKKVKAELDKKVTAEDGMGLSANDFTTAEKEKLAGLKNYTLPVTSPEDLGGIKVSEVTDGEDPESEDFNLYIRSSGNGFIRVDRATLAKFGLIKLGKGLSISDTDGSTAVDLSELNVPWANITGIPNIALKSDLTSVYKWRGSVDTFDDLPTEDVEVGDVYDVKDTGMNYGWTGLVWDALGEKLQITSITNEQIDALFSNETAS